MLVDSHCRIIGTYADLILVLLFTLAFVNVNIIISLCGFGLQFGSHSKKRPDNLVIGRTYDHQIYDLVEVGVENFKSMESFTYDKKLAPKVGSKPFIAFIGEGFESIDELKHLKEVLLDLLRGEVNFCYSVSFI